MDFNKILELHLSSMKNKDLAAFMSTVRLDDVTLIMPNGTLIRDKVEFVELHKDWFMDEDWALDYEILKTEESAEMAYVLTAVNYKDCDEKGNPVYMNYYLNLIFRKCGEDWLLIHDQNAVYSK
ncbi:YybH family protein [Haloimpatiens sp. FM7315]|uniref:YybH family protein n=1 Tax=Haloimpatiens sp. FM7315 TaxID=3298609 RepID=UPI00370A601B